MGWPSRGRKKVQVARLHLLSDPTSLKGHRGRALLQNGHDEDVNGHGVQRARRTMRAPREQLLERPELPRDSEKNTFLASMSPFFVFWEPLEPLSPSVTWSILSLMSPFALLLTRSPRRGPVRLPSTQRGVSNLLDL